MALFTNEYPGGVGAYITPDDQLNPKKESFVQMCAKIQKEVKHMKEQAKKMVLLDNNKHLVLFVHGYNNSEQYMNNIGQYLDEGLGTEQIITTSFNWKSYCNLLKYKADQHTATLCAKYFAFYLEEIRKSDIHKFKQIDIICHSMGNHVLIKTIQHCVKENKSQLFKGCNIICVASDAEKAEYTVAAKLFCDENKPIVSNWIHYWNKQDLALIVSGVVNDKTRSGIGHVNVASKYFHSIEWTKNRFLNKNHSYIKEMLDNDHEFKNDVLRWLNLKIQQNDKDVDDEKSDQQEFIKYLKIWNGMYSNSQDINRGGINTDWWWSDSDVRKEYAATCGVLKLQQHLVTPVKDATADNPGDAMISGVIQFARTVGWWSNHNDKYRIIWKPHPNADWKELYHSDDEKLSKEKFLEYALTIQWRNSTFH